jgi:uncharacterized integral membrane protein
MVQAAGGGRIITRIIFILLVLLVALTILTFVLENQQVVTLSLFGWSAPLLPISALILLSSLFGMVVGPMLRFVIRRKRTRYP